MKSRRVQKSKDRVRPLDKSFTNQKQLIETQFFQNPLLEKALVAYYIISGGKFIAVNQSVISYTGYSRKEIIGKDAYFLIHPDDLQKVKKNVRTMLAGSLSQPYEYRIITKQKEIRWIMEIVAPLQFANKPAVLGNSMDITQRKLTEERLIESENLYRAIFETTGTSTAIYEEDKTISLVNSGFEKLTGYRKEDWEGKKKWIELVDKKDRKRLSNYHRIRRADPNAVPRSYEYNLINSEGKILNVLSTVGVIPGSRRSVSSVMDITKLKEAEKELLQKSEKLTEFNSAMKVLLKQREDDRREVEATLLSNMKELVLPYIEKIRRLGSDKNQIAYVDLLAANLENILSPFTRTLSAKYMQLTSTEIEVANFIKQGKAARKFPIC